MPTENRITFVSDHLVDQIIDGRKTASVERLDQQSAQGEYDSALQVGDEYVVYDLSRHPRCVIRVTSIILCRWNDIPQWLWEGETNENAQDFRDDHVDYFDDPPDDFEFVGYEFHLVKTL